MAEQQVNRNRQPLFNFRLRDLDAIGPNGEPPNQTLNWFGLTDGWFWLDVGGAELLHWSTETLELEGWMGIENTAADYHLDPPGLPYVDYYVTRFWEDLLELLPAVLNPLPEPLALALEPPTVWRDWESRAKQWMEGDDGDWDLYYQATGWWDRRRLDLGYLKQSPRIWFWRVGKIVRIHWDNRERTFDGLPVWEATTGEVEMPLAEFLEEVCSFNSRFIEAMGRRVQAVREGWSREGVFVDVEHLSWELHLWGQEYAKALGSPPTESEDDWRTILEALSTHSPSPTT